MKIIPNTETVRHLCHYHGGSQYYLLAGNDTKNPVLVTDVGDTNLLIKELRSWCGMVIDVFSTESLSKEGLYAMKHGVALHLAAENMTLTEE